MAESKVNYIIPSDKDLIWFSGFFDGEGCVTFHRFKRKDGDYAYELLLQVAGTHFVTLEHIGKMWGYGQVEKHLDKRVDEKENWKPYWHWKIYGSKALFVLLNISPYLITKQSDARIGITFQTWKRKEVEMYGKSRRPESSYVKEQQLKDLLTEHHHQLFAPEYVSTKLLDILKEDVSGYNVTFESYGDEPENIQITNEVYKD